MSNEEDEHGPEMDIGEAQPILDEALNYPSRALKHVVTSLGLLNPNLSDVPSVQDIQKALLRKLGTSYTNTRFWKEGGTSYVFLTDFVIGGKSERRVVKVDKPSELVTSPRAKRHTERDYRATHEGSSLLDLPSDAEFHGIERVIDYKQLHTQTGKLGVLVKPYFQSSSLEDRIVEHGALPEKEARKVFSQLLDAVSYAYSHDKRLHRDLKPSNILVGEGKNKGKTLVIDWANTSAGKTVENKVDPTAGSIQVTDWQLMPQFNGNQSTAYTEQSEIYALGCNLFYMLFGKSHMEGLSTDAGGWHTIFPEPTDQEDLMQPRVGDTFEKNKAIVLQRLKYQLRPAAFSKEKRIYLNLLERMLTPDLDRRFKTFDEVKEAFEKATKPNVWERLKNNWKKAMALGTAGALALAGGTWYHSHVEDELNKAKDVKVTTEVDVSNYMEVKNNAFQLDVHVMGKNGVSPPEKFVRLDSKKDLLAILDARLFPVKNPLNVHGKLNGKIYFEGFSEVENITIDVGPFSESLDNRALSMNVSRSIEVLKDMPVGTYNLVFEVTSPISIDRPSISFSDDSIYTKYEYNSQSQVLSRIRVPVVLHHEAYSREAIVFGNIDPRLGRDHYSLRVLRPTVYETSEYLAKSAEDLEQLIKDKTLTVELISPEIGYHLTSNERMKEGLNLPQLKEEKDAILYGIVRIAHIPMHFTAIPIRNEFYLEREKNVKNRISLITGYSWEYGNFTADFQRKAAEFYKSYRENLAKESEKQ